MSESSDFGTDSGSEMDRDSVYWGDVSCGEEVEVPLVAMYDSVCRYAGNEEEGYVEKSREGESAVHREIIYRGNILPPLPTEEGVCIPIRRFSSTSYFSTEELSSTDQPAGGAIEVIILSSEEEPKFNGPEL